MVAFFFSFNQCHALLEITAGEHVGRPGEEIDIPIFISGPDGFLGVDLAFSVGDGGSVLGGIETIAITSVDAMTGPTVFDGRTIQEPFFEPGTSCVSYCDEGCGHFSACGYDYGEWAINDRSFEDS